MFLLTNNQWELLSRHLINQYGYDPDITIREFANVIKSFVAVLLYATDTLDDISRCMAFVNYTIPVVDIFKDEFEVSEEDVAIAKTRPHLLGRLLIIRSLNDLF